VSKDGLRAVLCPRSVVLVGASDVPGTLGDVLRQNLDRAGFKGEVRYVNPGHAQIAGLAAWPSVRDLPGPPADLAIIATPALTVPDVVSQCGAMGVRGAIVVSAGFRDGGEAGRALEAELRLSARRAGVRFLGPHSLGVIRTDLGLNAACGPDQPPPGRLAH
jgi:acetyltransferase